MGERPTRMSLLKPLRMAGIQFLACSIVVFIRALYVHGANLWNDPHLVNFAASWIPGIVSVIIGILPEKDWAKMRIHHRFLIIGVGLTWSTLLWHQQTLNEKNTLVAQTAIVNSAVAQANTHSDTKFGEVTQEVGQLQQQVQGVGSQIGVTLGQIGTDIDKVGKPDPPKLAKLEFGLWEPNVSIDKPPLQRTISPDKDGNYPVDFMFTNSSDIAAEVIDVWVKVCDVCSFASESIGFERAPGEPENERHRTYPVVLNGGVSAKEHLSVKSSDLNSAGFTLRVRYTCKTCGKLTGEGQVLTVMKGPVLP